jgi:hypothetical protein
VLATAVGDRFAVGFIIESFRAHGICYLPSDLDRSDLYLSLLPLINSGRARGCAIVPTSSASCAAWSAGGGSHAIASTTEAVPMMTRPTCARAAWCWPPDARFDLGAAVGFTPPPNSANDFVVEGDLGEGDGGEVDRAHGEGHESASSRAVQMRPRATPSRARRSASWAVGTINRSVDGMKRLTPQLNVVA